MDLETTEKTSESHAEAASATAHPHVRCDRPELLAPAGDWEALRAAAANGADSVYFGLSRFNARHRAANFTVEELPAVIEYLHARNVRGYVTFNTLIFSNELSDAVGFIRSIAEAGVDAMIVQDLGIAELATRLAPGLAVHGSTQMTLTEPRGIEFVKKLGVRRVVLARELSAADVGKIATASDMPLETFVHGALCVSYSGQCLTSEAIGGRSANRGQCAQACRLPYDLIVDGEQRDLGDKAYLLSPQDLAAYDLIDDLAELGVCSFKIEGRLKSAHYVAATTRTYRAAIDAAAERRAFAPSRQDLLDLAQSFSRGFTHGFLDGVDHQRLVHARFPKSRGVRIGRVAEVSPRGVLVEVEANRRDGFVADSTLKVGDGVVFDAGRPEQDEQGGRVASVRSIGRRIELGFDRLRVNLPAIEIGSIVWKTDDPTMRRRLEQTFNRERPTRRTPLAVKVNAKTGERLLISVRDDAGHDVAVESEQPLEAARKFPLTAELFREQFGRLGDTPFDLATVQGLETPAPVMAPKSVLNDLRRQAVERLLALREESERRRIAEPDALERKREEIRERYAEEFALLLPPSVLRGRAGEGADSSTPPPPQPSPGMPEEGEKAAGVGELRLRVLTRTMAQLQAAIAWKSASPAVALAGVYCEFEDIRQYKQAVAFAREAGVPIGLATLRVIKPGEEGLLNQIAQAEPDEVLIRNLAGLSWFAERRPDLPLAGDYALNVANELTADLFARHGVRRLTPSYDLSWKELTALLSRFPAGRFEAVVHQHMPMFHMEHCVFAHTLSDGSDYRTCGRPCDRHQVDLRDRAGAANPLVADVGCRNTVYNAMAQSAAEFVPRMKELGIRDYRVELLRESAEQTIELLNQYVRVFSGEDDGRQAWRRLRVLQQLGVTRGTLGD